MEKVEEVLPLLKLKNNWGLNSITFSNSFLFLRYAFLGLKFIFQNIDFWEKSFYYSSFYTKKLSFDPLLAHFWNSSTTPNIIQIYKNIHIWRSVLCFFGIVGYQMQSKCNLSFSHDSRQKNTKFTFYHLCPCFVLPVTHLLALSSLDPGNSFEK